MLEQPSSAPTNKDVEKALEAARNNVSVLEAESVRLDRLVTAQKRELISQEGAKRDIEDQITIAEGKLSILETQIDSLKKSKSVIEAEVEAKGKELVEREKEIAHRESLLTGREAAVEVREKKIEQSEKDLVTRTSSFETVRDHHLSQIDKIKQAITAL